MLGTAGREIWTPLRTSPVEVPRSTLLLKQNTHFKFPAIKTAKYHSAEMQERLSSPDPQAASTQLIGSDGTDLTLSRHSLLLPSPANATETAECAAVEPVSQQKQWEIVPHQFAAPQPCWWQEPQPPEALTGLLADLPASLTHLQR